MPASISSTRCMTTAPCDDIARRLDGIEEKLDLLIQKIGDLDGIKGFGVNLLANVLGNMLDGKK